MSKSQVINTINKSGGSSIIVVANYDALPNPTTVSGLFYWCESSQGTSWLPGGLGGTYYNSGMYYSNGVSWSFVNVPYQATQAEVDTGTITNKFVTPETLKNSSKWGSKQDTLTDVNFGSFANGLTAKTTPLDADLVNIVDTADSNKQKKLSFTNIKATLKTYFDTLYQATGLAMLKANNGSDIPDTATFLANIGADKLRSIGNTNDNILSTDKVVATSATLTASRTWTLPAANSVKSGREIIVADLFGGVSSTNTLVVSRAGSDTINGATSATIGAQYGMRRFISDGVSKWTFDGGVMRISDYIGTTLTASVIVGTDSNSKLQPLATLTYPSLTELAYVKGVTSAIQTQIDSKIDKSASAYVMRANNTNGTANVTDFTFKQIAQQVYSGSITWTAGTAPSGSTNHSYSWSQIGNQVSFRLNLSYSVAGATCTAVIFSLPNDMPNPLIPTGFTGASTTLYMCYGLIFSSITSGTNNQGRAYIRRNAADNGFELVITSVSTNAIAGWISGTYLTN